MLSPAVSWTWCFIARSGLLAALMAVIAPLSMPTSAVAGTDSWAQVASMSTPRAQNTQTLLPNGKVLVTGGVNDQIVGSEQELVPIITAEFYDPATNTWASAGSMSTPRSGHTATLLANGLVLVVGGTNGTTVTNNVDLYDPATNSWAPAAPL